MRMKIKKLMRIRMRMRIKNLKKIKQLNIQTLKY